MAISFAEAPEGERANWRTAMLRECRRYGLDPARTEAALRGEDPLSVGQPGRRWWEALPVVLALGVFVWLAQGAVAQPLTVHVGWMIALCAASLALLAVCGWQLFRRTRFS